MGEMVGDLISQIFNLDYDGATLLLLSFIVVVVGLVNLTKISREILYWFAIILTHPIGATMGDYLIQSKGMNFGNIKSSLILGIIFIVVIAA